MDNKKWKEAEKWENCANDDFKAMYNYYIKKKGLDWCLTSDFVGFEGKVREQNYIEVTWVDGIFRSLDL